MTELRRSSPVPALARIQAPLRADYAAIDEIYTIGASGADFGVRADYLAGVTGKAMGRIAIALDEASSEYDRRASAADSRATAGSAIAIFLLALAFVFLYRRATLARAVAERLARENARLAATSHEEARTDALTGLPNRRALIDDLEARAGATPATSATSSSRSSTSTASSSTTTPSATPPATRCSPASASASRTPWTGSATAYRMGGDEFCVLASVEPDAPTTSSRAAAACRRGRAHSPIGCSHGMALVPSEASSPDDALRLADQRMYAQKASPILGEPPEHGRAAQGSQRARPRAARPPQQRRRLGRADRRAARTRRARGEA